MTCILSQPRIKASNTHASNALSAHMLRRSMSTVDVPTSATATTSGHPRRLPPHKSTIQTLDLPDPRFRAVSAPFVYVEINLNL